jgi:hypothetical protein
MKDFLCFRQLLTPIIIQILFWIMLAVCWITGILTLFQKSYLHAFELIILAPLVLRVVVECVMVVFLAYECLQKANTLLEKK